MRAEVIARHADSESPTLSSFRLPPSYFPIVPLAVPYWNGETYRSILRCLISGHIIDGPELTELRSQIIATLGVDDALLCGSGSLALEIALRACEVKHGDEVVIPTFCCAAIVLPILAVGALPVLADVGEELNLAVETVEPVLTRKTKAIVVPHLFGNPAEIGAIVELAHKRNICVIDDAAQALGVTIDGQPVGSFGDAGILSFGKEKICFGLGGGAVVSRWKELRGNFSAAELARPRHLPTLRKFSSTLVWHHWRRWTLPLQSSLVRRYSHGPEAPLTPYRNENMANLNAAVACSLMQPLAENLSARRARARAYRDLLQGVQGLQLIWHRAGSACLTQVVRILPTGRGRDLAAEIIAVLGGAGYEIQGSYVPIHLLGNYPQCVWDRLPNAERIWADLIELPCEPSVCLDDVGQIASMVKAVISS